jgi:acylphosphatase
MSDADAAAARIVVRIRGRVQGVGFRYAAIAEARHLGITGWVRNTHDGDVELVAEGSADRLRRLLTWCHTGPPGARVTQVAPEWRPFAGEFEGFCLRP